MRGRGPSAVSQGFVQRSRSARKWVTELARPSCAKARLNEAQRLGSRPAPSTRFPVKSTRRAVGRYGGGSAFTPTPVGARARQDATAHCRPQPAIVSWTGGAQARVSRQPGPERRNKPRKRKGACSAVKSRLPLARFTSANAPAVDRSTRWRPPRAEPVTPKAKASLPVRGPRDDDSNAHIPCTLERPILVHIVCFSTPWPPLSVTGTA
jgi:hypothetical protein